MSPTALHAKNAYYSVLNSSAARIGSRVPTTTVGLLTWSTQSIWGRTVIRTECIHAVLCSNRKNSNTDARAFIYVLAFVMQLVRDDTMHDYSAIHHNDIPTSVRFRPSINGGNNWWDSTVGWDAQEWMNDIVVVYGSFRFKTNVPHCSFLSKKRLPVKEVGCGSVYILLKTVDYYITVVEPNFFM